MRAFPRQAEVRPKCGRLVAFSSGEENPHGVRAVTHGRRCAVALWFTFDVTSKEKVNLIKYNNNINNNNFIPKPPFVAGPQNEKIVLLSSFF